MVHVENPMSTAYSNPQMAQMEQKTSETPSLIRMSRTNGCANAYDMVCPWHVLKSWKLTNKLQNIFRRLPLKQTWKRQQILDTSACGGAFARTEESGPFSALYPVCRIKCSYAILCKQMKNWKMFGPNRLNPPWSSNPPGQTQAGLSEQPPSQQS